MNEIPLLVAFSAGLLSFLSPCVLPLVPVYIASIAGSEVLSSEAPPARMPVFFHSLSFVLGFGTVFILLGAGAGLLGLAIGSYVNVIRQISGYLLISLGAFLLLALKVPALNFEKRLNPAQRSKGGYLRSYITGGVFSMGWTPCVGPVLGGILTLALSSETVWEGAYLLAIYSVGLGLPFLFIGAFFDVLRPFLHRIRRYSALVYFVSALLLIGAGILVLTDKLALLSV